MKNIHVYQNVRFRMRMLRMREMLQMLQNNYSIPFSVSSVESTTLRVAYPKDTKF